MSFTNNLRDIINTLNILNKDKPPLPTTPDDIQTYKLGLEFISDTIFKILLICKTSKINEQEKLDLIQKIPDPDGDPFIDRDLAKWIYQRVPSLKIFYQKPKYTLKGGADVKEITGIVISPLKYAEQRLGPLVSIPLEITTMMVGTMGTICSMLSSSVTTLPLPPPVPDVLGKLMLGIHVFSNSFNVFLNIGRANWGIVIQSALGMFPQILAASNGLSLQLISINNFINTLNTFTSGIVNNSSLILPILKPIADNPISFLNPIKFNTYVFSSAMKLKDELVSKKLNEAKAMSGQAKGKLGEQAKGKADLMKSKVGDKMKAEGDKLKAEVDDKVKAEGDKVQAAADTAASDVTSAADTAASDVTSAADTAASDVTSVASDVTSPKN